MQVIVNALGRDWAWPSEDTKCREVVFTWSKDLRIVYPYVKKFDTVVQAGGNMGVWPWLLADKFKRVITFEADPAVIPYLMKNADKPNIEIFTYGLWSGHAHGKIVNHDRADNLGAQSVEVGSGSVELTTIDSLELESCDLIYLDIEGAEYEALKGAVDTIKEFKPVIVVEDKGLSKHYGTEKGDIEKWLAKEFGYQVVARPHRDVVMVCPQRS